jgi:hypothetical protein
MPTVGFVYRESVKAFGKRRHDRFLFGSSPVPYAMRPRSNAPSRHLPGKRNDLAHRALIISRMPNIFALRYNIVDGGLASYGVDNIDLYRRAAE